MEDGLVLSLEGRYGSECRTDSLDNVLHHDYYNNHQADFLSQVTSESQDTGLGDCNSVSSADLLEGD